MSRLSTLWLVIAGCGARSPASSPPPQQQQHTTAAPADMTVCDREFDREELVTARACYMHFATGHNPGLAGYAHYKLAWVAFRLGDRTAVHSELDACLLASHLDGERGKVLRRGACADVPTLEPDAPTRADCTDPAAPAAPPNGR